MVSPGTPMRKEAGSAFSSERASSDSDSSRKNRYHYSVVVSILLLLLRLLFLGMNALKVGQREEVREWDRHLSSYSPLTILFSLLSYFRQRYRTWGGGGLSSCLVLMFVSWSLARQGDQFVKIRKDNVLESRCSGDTLVNLDFGAPLAQSRRTPTFSPSVSRSQRFVICSSSVT